jgi:hypothetical protein
MAEHHGLLTKASRGFATSERAIFLLVIGYLYEELVSPLIHRGFAFFRSVHAHEFRGHHT